MSNYCLGLFLYLLFSNLTFYMKYLFLFTVLVSFTVTNGIELRIHESGGYIETTTGAPFLWIGDTAWDLFHDLDREEATYGFWC